MFVFVSDSTKQILLLLDAGERRVPVKVVGAVRLSSKDRGAPPTVGCGEGEDSVRGVASHDKARKRASRANENQALSPSVTVLFSIPPLDGGNYGETMGEKKLVCLTCCLVAIKVDDGHSLEAAGTFITVSVYQSQISI